MSPILNIMTTLEMRMREWVCVNKIRRCTLQKIPESFKS
jgi:hypothetical protein